jgi:plasmid stabilization system protein ParE
MYKIEILPLAKNDIQDAAGWYNNRQIGLGKRFTKEVRKKVNLIKNHPKGFTIKYENIRTAVLDVFPFMIHYTVNDNDKIIVVSAVLHTSRNPVIWKNRK